MGAGRPRGQLQGQHRQPRHGSHRLVDHHGRDQLHPAGHPRRRHLPLAGPDGRRQGQGRRLVPPRQPARFVVVDAPAPTAHRRPPWPTAALRPFPDAAVEPRRGSRQLPGLDPSHGHGGWSSLTDDFEYPAGEDRGTTYVSPARTSGTSRRTTGRCASPHGPAPAPSPSARCRPRRATAPRSPATRSPVAPGRPRLLRRDAAVRVPEPAADPGALVDADPRRALQAVHRRQRDDEPGERLLPGHGLRLHVGQPEGPAGQPGGLCVLLGGGPLRDVHPPPPLQHADHAFNKLSNQVELLSPATGATVSDDVTPDWRDFLATEQAAGTGDTSLADPGPHRGAHLHRAGGHGAQLPGPPPGGRRGRPDHLHLGGDDLPGRPDLLAGPGARRLGQQAGLEHQRVVPEVLAHAAGHDSADGATVPGDVPCGGSR